MLTLAPSLVCVQNTMCNNNNWKSYTLRTQLLIVLGVSVVASLLIAMAACVVYVFVSADAIETTNRQHLVNQAQAAMTNITRNALALFDYRLQVYAESFLGPIAHAAEDTHRSDFPLRASTAYYDWPTTMAPPILKNTSYNVPIS